MVMAARQLSVILTLNDRMSKQMAAARAQVDKFGATTVKTNTQIDKGFKQNEASVSKFLLALRRNFLAVTAVIGAGIALVAMFINAARDHARSITILDGALQSIGTSWDEQKNKIQGVLDVVGAGTGASETTMIGALSSLILETGNLEAALSLLEPAFGLAARTGIPVADAAKLISEALKGDEGAVAQLEALGLRFDEAAGAGGRLNSIMEFTDGWAGKNKDKVTELSKKWEEFKVLVGEELLPALEPLLQFFIDIIPAIAVTLDAIKQWVEIMVAPLKILSDAIKAVRRLLGLNEETGEAITHDRNAGASRSFGQEPPELMPGWQGPGPAPIPPGFPGWNPFVPGSGEQSSGVIGQGMNVTIVSNGDLDADRRIIERLDSAYRSGWRSNT